MAAEFRDILSEALDESGITGELDEMDFDQYDFTNSADVVFDTGQSDTPQPLTDGPTDAPITQLPVPVNSQAQSDATTVMADATQSGTDVDSEWSDPNASQLDMFTQALQQMAATSHIRPKDPVPVPHIPASPRNVPLTQPSMPAGVGGTQPSMPAGVGGVGNVIITGQPTVQQLNKESITGSQLMPRTITLTRTNSPLPESTSGIQVINSGQHSDSLSHRHVIRPGQVIQTAAHGQVINARQFVGSLPRGQILNSRQIRPSLPHSQIIMSVQHRNTIPGQMNSAQIRGSVPHSTRFHSNVFTQSGNTRHISLDSLNQLSSGTLRQLSHAGLTRVVSPQPQLQATKAALPNVIRIPRVLANQNGDTIAVKTASGQSLIAKTISVGGMKKIILAPVGNAAKLNTIAKQLLENKSTVQLLGNGKTVKLVRAPSDQSVNTIVTNSGANVMQFSSSALTTANPSILTQVPSAVAPTRTVSMSTVINPYCIRPVVSSLNSIPSTVSMLDGSLSRHSPVLFRQVSGTPHIPACLTDKDVSRIWSNEDMRLKNLSAGSRASSPLELLSGSVMDEEEAEESEELGQAETYSEYMPSKLNVGEKHPDSVVETSSLSSVEPPPVWYSLAIPESTIDYGQLSALQLEAIVYACQKHDTILPSGQRAGFLIGDGAGVGKGRTIAGLIYENYLLGHKRAIWLSVSNDLRVDAERDLRDIGASKIEVHPLNKFKYGKISSRENGSVKKGVIFATYSSLIGESHSGGKYRTRLKQLMHWCGEDFDGVLVFDECHKAKNLAPAGSAKPTKTGKSVLELQNKLPKARVVYASATGATEPRNMAYMTRLGLWGPGTPFKEFNDFISAVEKRGVGAMELVAMEMKLRGMYIARQLSFHGVTFRIDEIALPRDLVKVYNESVKLWVDARSKFQLAAELIEADHKMRKTMWGQFWSAHQRFFKYMCMSCKVNHCVRLVREAVKNGKCVVIGLQSTGEARTLEQLEESGGELTDFVSTAKGVFQTLVEKHFPAPDRKKMADFLGFGDYLNSYDSSAPSSPKPKPGAKRTPYNNHNAFTSGNKRSRLDSDGSSDSDASLPDKSSESEASNDSESSSDAESEGNDDFNPFAAGSDSDDDPWLKKTSDSAKPKKEKKVKKKKEKVKKPKKKRKRRQSSDDNDDEVDEKFDKALTSAGLMNKNSSFPDRSSSNVIPSPEPRKLASADAVEQAFNMKNELLSRLESLGDRLPPNTLDQLIDELGGPEYVAEMTGRKGRVVSSGDGRVSYESRSEADVPLEILNLTEKQRFMDAEKNIAIISEAASSGISLQADRRAINQRRRVHVTLELPWSADRAIQQFGRTHRSNQVTAPEYVFMISDLAGERRFAATVARRLESLGALTHGDRRATETRDLSRFNIDNKYGRTALEAVMKSVLGFEAPIVQTPGQYSGNFFPDVQKAMLGVALITGDERCGYMLDKDYNNISKFLNRILGMTVELQNALFQYFTETMSAVISEAKRSGRWDMGILDLGSGSENVQKMETKTFLGSHSSGTAKTELFTVSVERGLSWDAAMDVWRDYSGSEDGFYVSVQLCNGKRTSILAVAHKHTKKSKRMYSVYRPNTGLLARMEPLEDIKKKYRKSYPDDATKWWKDQYHASLTTCTHAYWKGHCRRVSVGLTCEIGLRQRIYHILGGSVLSVWSKVESVLASVPGGAQSKMQLIRIRTQDGHRIVGSLIPASCVKALSHVLSENSKKTASELERTKTMSIFPRSNGPKLLNNVNGAHNLVGRKFTTIMKADGSMSTEFSRITANGEPETIDLTQSDSPVDIIPSLTQHTLPETVKAEPMLSMPTFL